ncbi:MAG: hypothetical protein ACXWBP_03870 [Limisphaerales bacterium]
MAKMDYMPKRDAAALAMHDRFTAEMVARGAALGFSPAQIAAHVSANAAFHEVMAERTALRAAAKANTSKKNATRKTVDALIRRDARWMKTGPAYKPEDGFSFGIVGHEPSVDLKTSKPKLRGKDLGRGRVQLRYKKLTSHGVKIYGQRDDETEWKLLLYDNNPPAFDEREMLVAGKPELRRYRCRYVLHDEEIGDWSDVTVVSCAP